jgi:hypothetical protein
MDLRYWQKALLEAEQELELARGKSATDAAARKVMRAKREMKLLEAASAEKPKAGRRGKRT